MIPIRIHKRPNSQKATNGAMGIDIDTGVRYFAAVLLQEYYEGIRNMAWIWTPFLLFSIAAFLITPLLAAGALAWMVISTQEFLPTRKMREARELRGQAIEIAAIFDFYELPEEKHEFEYRLQARSIVRESSPYSKRGFWPHIDRSKPDEAIDTMVEMLKGEMPKAKAYVAKHRDKLAKWRPLGAESLGY